MNKQRYLAELRRLLVFMTEADKDAAVERFSLLFDAAGTEGEQALVDELGSPTKAAIGMSRKYAPGKVEVVLPPLPEGVAAPEKKPAPKAKPEDIWSDIPDFRTPIVGDEEPEPEEPEEDEEADEDEEAPEDRPARSADRTRPERREPRQVVERGVPLWLGIPLFILVFAALGIPLAAIVLVLSLVLLIPGCACLFGAYLIFVGGLWCLSYIADAILLFGLSLIALSLGLLILWAGIWLAVKLIRLYCRFIRWLGGELLGRKVWTYE